MKPGGSGISSTDAAAADVDVEVVASGEALRIASGWIGMSADDALQEAGPTATSQAAVPAKRPQYLGLGAKYLPHRKAVETASALDSKLRKRLERGLEARRLAEEEGQEERRGGAARASAAGTRLIGRGAPLGKQAQLGGLGKRPTPGAQQRGNAGGCGDGDATDSDGEEGKVAAVIGKAGLAEVAVSMSLGSKAAREAALLYAPVDGVVGRKGKGKKKQRAA